MRLGILALAVTALSCPACKSLTPARSPECNDIINRCVQSCSDAPEALSPANQTIDNGSRSHTPPASCEQRCRSKCSH